MKLPGLCSVCEGCLLHHEGLLQEADESAPDPTWMFKAHMDIKSLTASRDASCTICALLWTLLSEEQTIFLSTFDPDPSEMLTLLMVWKNDSLSALGKATEECWFVAAAFWDLPNEWPGLKPLLQFILEPAAGIYSFTLHSTWLSLSCFYPTRLSIPKT
jgi:hypothetical protein